MTRDVIDINDFTVLVETNDATSPVLDACGFDEPVIGIAFYGSGDVELSVNYKDKQQVFKHTKGLSLSFYADREVQFVHQVKPRTPLRCVLIVTAISRLKELPYETGELFADVMQELVHPTDSFVLGPRFLMGPELQNNVQQVFDNRYEGKARLMFFRTQMMVLLAHYFGHLSMTTGSDISNDERLKLLQAKEILSSQMDDPPSLTELSRRIGLNTTRLKRDFKELFGVPVFKYLQNERLTRAHELIRNKQMTVQEAAWHVGYDSLSSFSNAFVKKFGFRPSDIRS